MAPIRRPSLFFYCLIIMISQTYANTVTVSEQDQHINLNGKISHIEDEQGRLNITSVSQSDTIWPPVISSAPMSLGFTLSTHWLRIKLFNKEEKELERWLQIAFPLIDTIDVYQSSNTGPPQKLYHTGDTVSFNIRAIEHGTFLLPIKLPAQSSTTLFIKIFSKDVLLIPISLWNPKSFWKFNQSTQLIYGLCYGGLAIMMVYLLVLYIMLRDKSILLFSCHELSVLISLLCLNGTIQQFLFRDNPDIASWIFLSMHPIVAIFILLFSSIFLNLKQSNPILFHTIKCLIATHLIGGLLIPFIEKDLAYSINSFIYILTLPTLLVSGIRRWQQGFSSAKFYLLSWSFYLTGCFISICIAYSLLPANAFTLSSAQIGAVFTMVSMALAIAYKLVQERKKQSIT